MINVIYLILAVAWFLVVAAMHVISHFQEIPGRIFYSAFAGTFLLCIPLIRLGIQVKKKQGTNDFWQTFWDAALAYCPRWIWESMRVAFWLMIISGLGLILQLEIYVAAVHSACLLVFAGAVLSYAVTIIRRPRNEAPNKSGEGTA